eukprot:scaffold25077_cov48-Cyclotella_meneghiniana.AAC.9
MEDLLDDDKSLASGFTLHTKTARRHIDSNREGRVIKSENHDDAQNSTPFLSSGIDAAALSKGWMTEDLLESLNPARLTLCRTRQNSDQNLGRDKGHVRRRHT